MKRLQRLVDLKVRGKVALGGALGGLALLALTAGPLFAGDPTQAPTPVPSGAPSHEQMHQMMDALGGVGTSERMHEAMGPDGEQLMDQCLSMMGLMQTCRV